MRFENIATRLARKYFLNSNIVANVPKRSALDSKPGPNKPSRLLRQSRQNGCKRKKFPDTKHFNKSSMTPITCGQDTIQEITPFLSCPIKELPSSYLGLRLSLCKLRKEDLQHVLDKLANKLAFWVAYVHLVMAATVVYQLMALDVLFLKLFWTPEHFLNSSLRHFVLFRSM
jgi:hypothetical protein